MQREPANAVAAGRRRAASPPSRNLNRERVFSLTKTGRENVLHSFAGGHDGANPMGGLIDVNGTFYGTTAKGGTSNDGTVFTITRDGTESVLYSFQGDPDGSNPAAGLESAYYETLLGTTSRGGEHNDGTVFKITLSGTEKVRYSFAGKPDGRDPHAGLVEEDAGTTVDGGTNDGGMVFRWGGSGEYVLHSFTGSPDGRNPYGRLVVAGVARLYGTTNKGGASGRGTIFIIILSQKEERVIHSFGAEGDGHFPRAGLLWVSSVQTLYGTTEFGGTANGGWHSASGAETVLIACSTVLPVRLMDSTPLQA